jgi:hypothetical protein
MLRPGANNRPAKCDAVDVLAGWPQRLRLLQVGPNGSTEWLSDEVGRQPRRWNISRRVCSLPNKERASNEPMLPAAPVIRCAWENVLSHPGLRRLRSDHR